MHDKRLVGSLIGISLMILLLPLRWLLAAMTAALLHELGHYCAVRLLGGSVHQLQFGFLGAVMNATGLTQRAEIICLLAGPLVGLFPLLFFRYVPTIALCGTIQSAYNLLPITPLDGGKILNKIILISGGHDAHFRVIERITIILLFLLCIYVWFRFGVSLFIFWGILLFRKTPCKPQ